MIIFKYANGGIGVPIQEFAGLQKNNLERIKFYGEHIPDLQKVSVYYPEVRFKNVARRNEDGTIDLIINPSVANEFGNGFLPKPFYKGVRVKKEKGLLGIGSKWTYVEMLQVSEREILGTFMSSLEIDEVTEVLEDLIEKGVKYFD
ncbi:hypothetical protein ABLU29_09650 [Lactococcus lactis]|uniref:hypothetical protein n=1 Tax=Lactococcus lactis TaxID=1358 RepID=UPI00387842F7